jgi:hypothetical protein
VKDLTVDVKKGDIAIVFGTRFAHVHVQADLINEKNRLRKSLLPDHCYVIDRWYAQFTLWNEIVAAESSYVCRIRDNSNLPGGRTWPEVHLANRIRRLRTRAPWTRKNLKLGLTYRTT